MLTIIALVSTIQLGNGAGFHVSESGGYIAAPVCLAWPCTTDAWFLHITADQEPNSPGFWVIERHVVTPKPPLKLESDPEGWSWADSRSCKKLNPLLTSLVSITPPAPTLPGLYAGTPASMIADDGNYRIWMQGVYRAGGRQGAMAISGSALTPVYNWIVNAEQELEDCWSAMPPKGVLQNGRR